ncbi:MAG: DUF1697 domain-containing protein [Burkholderiales bacterium]|nr:DUF1697 domain-containing protein [Bacteroidia bacterium]
MQTYIAILRGINVSGHKMMKMEALRHLLEDLNFKNIKTYIQSGNIVFQDKKTNVDALGKKIAKKISDNFDFEVPVIVKEEKELNDVLNKNPFLTKRKEDITKLHVTFLSDVPEKANVDKIIDATYQSDEFIIIEKVVYIFCPNGYGNTKLNNTFFENKLKVTATTRNWKTISELVKLASQLSL